MKVWRNLQQTDFTPCVATIGFFDGLHLGHRYLIEQVKQEAAKTGQKTLVITFDEHPRAVLQPDFKPTLLTTTAEKLDLIAHLGVDHCLLLPFDKAMAQLTAQQFMTDILYDCLQVRSLVIGYDHRFGRNRSEGFDDYVRYGQTLGMQVLQAQQYKLQLQATVSSSAIRLALGSGDVMTANSCLGRTYTLSGQVVVGRQVGRTIGFPTANVSAAPLKLIPADGVYIVKVEVEQEVCFGMLNIGTRPTFADGVTARTIEVHLINHDSDLYGRTLTLHFLHRLRDEMRFDSIDALTTQLHKDRLSTLSWLHDNELL